MTKQIERIEWDHKITGERYEGAISWSNNDVCLIAEARKVLEGQFVESFRRWYAPNTKEGKARLRRCLRGFAVVFDLEDEGRKPGVCKHGRKLFSVYPCAECKAELAAKPV